MTEMLRIKGWARFQHYKDRNPPWIKLHRDIFASEDWVMLADASKLLMVVCMVVGARHNGMVPNNPDYLKRVAYLEKRPNLKPLIECGFLEKMQADDSAALAGDSAVQADACPETESDTEQSDSSLRSESQVAGRADGAALDEAFETWWSRYPRYRRGAKGPARKKWLGVIRRGAATPEQLLAGLDRYVAAGYGDSQFACGAEVWLNGERWTIEHFPPPGDQVNGGANGSGHRETRPNPYAGNEGFIGAAARAVGGKAARENDP